MMRQFINFIGLMSVLQIRISCISTDPKEIINTFFEGEPLTIAEPKIFVNKCIEDLGCFYTGPPFYHKKYRPVSLPPEDGMQIKYHLFTRNNKEKSIEIKKDLKSINNSPFDETLPVKIIIHGFMEEHDDNTESHLFDLKDALLEEGNYNVIMLEWNPYNYRDYNQAVANLRVCGALLAQFINFLKDNKGINPRNVHLLGHSLGSHLAGNAGERVPGLGRITGLDPAGPLFRLGHRAVNLDDTDAEFVDVIHTDGSRQASEGLGMFKFAGAIDFYPNKGKGQPGCKAPSEGISALATIAEVLDSFMLNLCNHRRSVDLYIASIKFPGKFMGVKCSNYTKFQKGECAYNQQAEMGHYSIYYPKDPNPRTPYFLKTTAEYPYYIENYG